MKKALLAALCFIIVSLVLVNGTFALPDLDKVFADLRGLLGIESGLPEIGGAGTAVHVELDSDQTPQNLYPGSKVSRTFQVQNLGSGDVYFRLVYAIQYDEESWPKLDIVFGAGDGFIEARSTDEGFDADGWKNIIIGNTPYKMKVFTYTNELPANFSSPEVSITIGMDTAVTSEQVSRYRSDFLKTQVLAIDPTPFTEKGYSTAVEALNLALPLDTLSPF